MWKTSTVKETPSKTLEMSHKTVGKQIFNCRRNKTARKNLKTLARKEHSQTILTKRTKTENDHYY